MNRRPRVGDLGWQVDWCRHLPTTPEGDADIDGAEYITETYRSQASAERRAREVYPLDAFGAVAVRPVEFHAYDDDHALRRPDVGYWEEIGDPVYYEGEMT